MKAQELTTGPRRSWALVFDRGDEVKTTLERFAERHDLTAAQFTGIGALSDATLGYFDWERKDYVEIPVEEQVEVLTLAGDVADRDGQPEVHAHLVVGRSTGEARGGHLLAAHVRPTLEIVLREAPAHLRKRHDEETGLALIDVDASHA